MAKDKLTMKASQLVIDIVKKSEDDFEIIDGLRFNYRDVINRIYYYRNDKFVECNDDRAIFWNIVKPFVMHFSKNIDLDPKDFRVIGRGETNYAKAWILNLRFAKWSNDENFSVKIDDLTQLVSEFGSYVWKLMKKDGVYQVDPCDLRHLYFDPTVEFIRDANIVEKHYLTDNEIKAKDEAWDNVDELIGKAVVSDLEGEFEKKEIWEYTGYLNGEYKHIIGAGYGDNEVIAFEQKMDKDDCKYFDFHLDKYTGSWLRKGIYQTNFILQERANTLVNENAAATSIASLLLLRSQDPATKGNVLNGALPGQIITSADLQQIPIDNRAAGLLLSELDRIELQVRKNLMLPDVATGDRLPSGTTFRGQALQSNASKSAFKQMRTRIAEPLKDIVQDYTLPSLVKGWNREDILELAGNEADIRLYDDGIKARRRIKFMKNRNKLGIAVSQAELAQLDVDTDQQITKIGRKIEHGKNFFNFDYGFIIDPTGETFDKAQQNDAIIQAITMVAQNPAIAAIPAFNQLLENNGIKSFDLRPDQKDELMANNNPMNEQPAFLGDPGVQQKRALSQNSLFSAVDTGGV